ncbi:hypothetical protein MTBPR1_80189 [Candidatus Terasakiella magnetica]|uniref:Uncharacterized protein n=1 Tax=Candidatus Terasakiella magnetica TaxID=1867952 RepID=A0A1C3RLI3_9PROT|nr:TrbI/VirB10 family protein [Candidatus Terasakiella magnetica]SCA58135.1 hypothetical protein MTBPR1_80189 [Candidatus Terasakiella magnetica]
MASSWGCAFLAIFGACGDEPPQKTETLPPIPETQEIELIGEPEPEPAAPPPPPPKVGKLAVRPLNIDFGAVLEGDLSSVKTVRLQNVGDGPLLVGHFGLPRRYIKTNDDCPPQLAPGQHCQINLSLDTARPGLVNETLSVAHTKAKPYRVSLSANIIAKPVPPPEPEPEPEPIVYEAPPPPEPSREELLRDLARKQRYKARPTAIKNASYTSPLAQQAQAKGPSGHWRYQDKSYKGIGIAKTEVSYPVDRCRVITEDAYIDASIENSVNSMIGGRIVATVSYPVMGSECNYVLIPPGTRIVGEFKPLEDNSITRLEVAWRRMILPDGSSVIFDFGAADVEGKSGYQGEIDDRKEEKYATIFAISAIDMAMYGAAAYFQNQSSSTGQAVAQINTNTSSQLGEVTAAIIQQQLNIKNVLRLHKRLEVKIIPTADLWFPEAVYEQGVAQK